VDELVLWQGGAIATYASRTPNPEVPFWPLVFKNVRIHFLGSDDFGLDDKVRAANDLTEMLRGIGRPNGVRMARGTVEGSVGGAQAAQKNPPGEGGLAFLGKRAARRTGGTRGCADGPRAYRDGRVQS